MKLNREMTFDQYSEIAREADIALWTPTSLYGKWIAASTDGPFSHVSCIAEMEGRLFNIEYLEGEGGHISTLSSAAKRNPGAIHIHRIKTFIFDACLESPDNIACEGFESIEELQQCMNMDMLEMLDGAYSWSAIRLIAMTKMAGFRFLAWGPMKKWRDRKVRELSSSTREGICSEFVARTFGRVGIRLTSRPYAETSPNDIGNAIHGTSIGEYVCTIV